MPIFKIKTEQHETKMELLQFQLTLSKTTLKERKKRKPDPSSPKRHSEAFWYLI